MSDYNTHKDFGSGDRICYHGVLDMFRIPKEAARVYSSQQDERPVMEVATAMVPGERDAGVLKEAYVFTNCDSVRVSKNGAYLGTHRPDCKAYPGVPHPPVVITDFIGDLIEQNEGLSRNDAKVVKEVLLGIVKHGDKSLPFLLKIKMALLMFKRQMPYGRAVELYSTYVANWGSKSLEYEFTGYAGDKPSVTVCKGPANSKGLSVVADKDRLVEEETYDVCRIVLRHLDEFGNVMTFSNEAISLETEGPGEVVGPRQLALIGGSIAFWIKSIGQIGAFHVSVRSQRFDDITLSFAVEKAVTCTVGS
jgi:beta-galactosidase